MSSIRLIACAALGLGFAQTAWPQGVPDDLAGRRVRLSTPCVTCDDPQAVDQFTGTVVTITDGQWILADGRVERRVPVSSVSRIEQYEGSSNKAASGALIGLLSGAFIGGVAAASMISGDCEDSPTSWDFCISRGTGVAAAAGAGGLLGLVFGTIIGVASRTEHWDDVTPSAIALDVKPDGSKVSIGLSFGW